MDSVTLAYRKGRLIWRVEPSADGQPWLSKSIFPNGSMPKELKNFRFESGDYTVDVDPKTHIQTKGKTGRILCGDEWKPALFQIVRQPYYVVKFFPVHAKRIGNICIDLIYTNIPEHWSGEIVKENAWHMPQTVSSGVVTPGKKLYDVWSSHLAKYAWVTAWDDIIAKCSATVGVGSNYQEHWEHAVHQGYNISVVQCMGVPGYDLSYPNLQGGVK